MPKKTILFLSLLLFSSLLLITENANAAAIGDCDIIVDWSTMSIDGGGYTVNWEYKGFNSSSWINGPDSSNPGYQETGEINYGVTNSSPDWDNPSLHNALGQNTSDQSASATQLRVNTTSYSRGDGDTSGWINGNLHRGISLNLLDSAAYTFSVDYSINVTFNRDNENLENASNGIQISCWLADSPPINVLFGQDIEVYNSNFGVGELVYSLQDSGTLSFTIPDITPDYYWFETHLHGSTSTSSQYINPIPLPPAIWLLGSGLIGLVGFKRKFRKA